MINWTHRSIIVPDAHAQLARDLCAALAGPGGAGMFTTGLSADGSAPATHWISAGLIDAQLAALLPLVDTPGQPETVLALAQQAGMAVTLDQVQALLAAVVVTELEPLAAIAEQGLVLVNQDQPKK